MKCPNCGAEIKEGLNFCPNCGQKLDEVEQLEINQEQSISEEEEIEKLEIDQEQPIPEEEEVEQLEMNQEPSIFQEEEPSIFQEEEPSIFQNEEVETKDVKITNIELIEKPKKSHIGLVIGIIIIIILIALSFIFMTNNKTDNKLEDIMIEASSDYFKKYMSVNDSTSAYVVTLDMLENANNEGENYNLTGLENCKKQSTLARVTVDFKTGEPRKIEVELNC